MGVFRLGSRASCKVRCKNTPHGFVGDDIVSEANFLETPEQSCATQVFSVELECEPRNMQIVWYVCANTRETESPMRFNRKNATDMSTETLRIIAEGQYVTPSGTCVTIADALTDAVRGTHTYPPDKQVVPPETGERGTCISVRNESTLEGIRCLATLNSRT